MGEVERPSQLGEDDPLGAFLGPLKAVQQFLAVYHDRGVVIGGVAASLLGVPRMTADIDVLLLTDSEDVSGLLAVALAEHFSPRIEDVVDFARKYRVVLLRHSSGMDVDISLGMLPFETEAVERGRTHQVGQVAVRLPTPEDLIIMKAIAHRPKDLLDVQGIFEQHSNLDIARIRKWVREFSELLDSPDIIEAVAPWIS